MKVERCAVSGRMLSVLLCVVAANAASALSVQIIAPQDGAVLARDSEQEFRAYIVGVGDDEIAYEWWFSDTGERKSGTITPWGPHETWQMPLSATHRCSVPGAQWLAVLSAWWKDDGPVDVAEDTIHFTVAALGIDADPAEEDDVTCVGIQHTFTASSAPEGLEITQPQWTVTGSVLASYDVGANTAAAVPLTPGDLQETAITFHWYDGGTNTVGLSAHVDDVPLTAEQQTWTVQEPTGVTFTLTKGPDSGIAVYGSTIKYGTPGVPAMRFDFSATAPADFGGDFAFVQTIDRSATAVNYDDETGTFSTGGAAWLDNVLPYMSTTRSAPAGQSVQGSLWDTPTLEVAPFSEASDSLAFRTWLLFRPGGGAWVPLSSGEWTASSAFHEEGDPPQAIKDDGALSATPPAPTLDYPVWSDRYVNYPPHPVWVW